VKGLGARMHSSEMAHMLPVLSGHVRVDLRFREEGVP